MLTTHDESTKPRLRALVAVHAFFRRDDEILLLRRSQTGYEDGNFSVPAGHLDGGETATAAMVREIFEETGVRVTEHHLRLVHVMHRRSEQERIDFFFDVVGWSGTPENREPDKCDDMRWFSLRELPDNMVPYVRWALEYCRWGRIYSEFGW